MEKIDEVPVFPPRAKDSHKGNFGKILVVAGSSGMMGAACLCAEACLRSGAGLVTLGVPRSLLGIASVKLTCAMTCPFPETEEGTFSLSAMDKIVELAQRMDTLAIGPGMSRHPQTQEMVRELLPRIPLPVVVDADGLDALAGHTEILEKRSAPTIITPHPGEFSRITGASTREVTENSLEISSDFAREKGCVVVLKVAPALVTDGKRFYLNTTGNPGMATGGSGDVLTGAVVALLGQKFDPFSAARMAVWAHGKAGDLACEEKGETGMIASDILERLPHAFKWLESHSKG